MSDPRGYTMPASMFEKLDYRLFSWPGHGVRKEAGFQYNEREWMPAEDYDDLIADPTGYLLRTYLPRTVGAFAGFSGLSSFLNLTAAANVAGHLAGWASPEMADSLRRIGDAAREVAEWASVTFPLADKIRASGFPPFRAGLSLAPFDILGDTLRGTKGAGDRHLSPPGEGVRGLRAPRASGDRLGHEVSRTSRHSDRLHPPSQGR